ncbi:hypothetical protein OG216_47760 (plasmid) [Streptomycetaceae bacterium NBC_01309]
MRDARHEANAIRSLDGRYHVTVTLHRAALRDGHRVTEIAHELGYRITNVFATRSNVYLDFTAEETRAAQTRAAATAARLDVGLPVPTARPSTAAGPTSFDAARARFETAGRSPRRPNLKLAARIGAASLVVTAAGVLVTDHCPACRLAAAAGAAVLVAAVWTTAALFHAFHLHRRRVRCIEAYDRAADTPTAVPVAPRGATWRDRSRQ